MKQTTWQHANGDMLAIVDTETTGLRAGYNDVIQLAVLPVNGDLKPMGVEPFNLIMQPAHPKNISKKAMQVNGIKKEQILNAPTSEDAFFIFEKWFEKNVTGKGYKKIIPIGQNIQFDQGFIKEWMGWDERKRPDYNWSEDFFEWRKSRDTKYIAEYMNDLAYFNNQQFPFPRTSLSYLATRFGLNTDGAHDAMFDCEMTGKVYRSLLAFRVRKIDFGAIDE